MPPIDYSSSDPEFSQAQADPCVRIVEGIRKINAKVLQLGGSLAALMATADRVEELLASLDEVTGARVIETYRVAFDLSDPNNVLPFNPATGVLNPIAPAFGVCLHKRLRQSAACRIADDDCLVDAKYLAGSTDRSGVGIVPNMPEPGI